jgi:hypothetical protein
MPTPERSRTVPVLVAVLVCDTTATDPASGKKTLIGIFDRIHVRQFPTNRPLSLYSKITDAEGSYDISIRFVQVETGQTLAEVVGEGNFTDRLVAHDLTIEVPPLPIPSAGRYEFQVWFNDVFLGSTFLDAVARD